MRPELREERRRHIAEAVISIAAERGMGEISLRSVARQAEASTGQIQYQFGSMDDVVCFALEHVVAAVEAVVGEEPGLSGQDRLRSIAERLIAPDPDTTRYLRAYAQLRTLVTREGRFRAAVEDASNRQRTEFEALLRQAKSDRLLHDLVDPASEADVFWSLMISTAIEAAQGLRDHSDGLSLIRYHFVSLARNKRIARPSR